jgi:myo-inositol 2-dehydrogenase/D-chiro-inositol 1-dehydrogenase
MTVRIGVIGVGMIGQDHIRRLTTVLAGSVVTAVADVDPARAAGVASRVEGCISIDAHDLIGHDSVDAVVVASWGPTHEEFVLAAIEAGKPVFCEKPLATTQDACQRIVDAEVASGRHLVQVGFMRRFDEHYRALRSVVDSGDLGAPLLMHLAHRIGQTAPNFTTEMMVNDAAIHEIDLIRWMFDEEIVEVTGLSSRHNPTSPDALADPLVLVFKTASGVLANVEVFANGGFGYDIRGEVVAQHGTAALPELSSVTVKKAGLRSDPVPADWRERFIRAYDIEFQEWVDRIAAGLEPNGPSSWDGLAAATVADATVAALRDGRTTAVTLPTKPQFYAQPA